LRGEGLRVEGSRVRGFEGSKVRGLRVKGLRVRGWISVQSVTKMPRSLPRSLCDGPQRRRSLAVSLTTGRVTMEPPAIRR
jgi:hypothetical protein